MAKKAEPLIYCKQCMKEITRDEDAGNSNPVSAFGLRLYDDSVVWFCSIDPCAINHPLYVKAVMMEREKEQLVDGLRRVNGARLNV